MNLTALQLHYVRIHACGNSARLGVTPRAHNKLKVLLQSQRVNFLALLQVFEKVHSKYSTLQLGIY